MKTILVDVVHAFVIKGEGIYKPMHDLLEQYPNRKIILTGANDAQMDEFGLRDVPYDIFTLKHNPEKTDPLYYRKMLEHFGLAKDNVIYFEHDSRAVESAQLIGINSYYYDNDKKNIGALKEFLDKNL